MRFDKQSSIELEFQEIREILASYCKSEKGANICERLNSFNSLDELTPEYNILNEIQKIYKDDEKDFPHPRFSEINRALQLLNVENGVLTLDELAKIYEVCIGTKRVISFAEKNKDEFPYIYQACEHIERVNDLILVISKILNDQNKIKDNASDVLLDVRNSLRRNEITITKNFDVLLKSYKSQDFIGSVEETYLENRRLLAVLSQHKRKVKGRSFGVSSGGALNYIEPIENADLNKSQDKLRIAEQNEIFLILREVTELLREERSYLSGFERLLIRFDVLNAKVLLGQSYDGTIPKRNEEKKLNWISAKHPLLLRTNNTMKLSTIGQDIQLNPKERFLVISGPNAGGKSITLKTVGLLQMMFQSGLFVPVDELSQFCWFGNILSDIGDNQSIEDQLSTYSYRLKRMNLFLKESDKDTLLLLDEFGTGSDPELGGALAEIFFDELYQRKTFAVITTHYMNIKVAAADKEESVNACMLFDTKLLKPLYVLSVGEPGSSFTFEVAKINGIDDSILERAKEKVSDGKIQLDKLSVALQKEKSKLKKFNDKFNKNSIEASKTIREYSSKLSKIKEQADRQTRFFQQQGKYLSTGKKLYEFIGKYKKDETNKNLNEALKKFVAIEKKKVLEVEKPVVLEKNLKVVAIDQIIKEEKKAIVNTPTKEPIIEVKDRKPLKVGDKIKLVNQNGKAEVVEIKGKKLKVVLGNLSISTTMDKVDWNRL